ncbi:MAG: Ig domain-containing protein [Oscillospiraceae bacterium]|nr:Ig domain-containing protein [Oscillospiraceae bacterium]
MSLLKCRKCGEMFSDSYKSCPFCAEDEEYYNGKVKKRNHRRMEQKHKAPSIVGPLLVLVIVLIIAVAVWAFFGDTVKSWFDGRPGSEQVTPTPGTDDQQSQDGEKDPTPVKKLTLNKAVLMLAPGGSEQLTVSGGAEGQEYVWQNSDPAVLTVSEEGKVTAVAVGSAVVTVTCGDESAVCAVTVKEHVESDPVVDDPTPPVNSKVDLSKVNITVPLYGTSLSKIEDGKFDVSLSRGESFGLEVQGTDVKPNWSVANSSIATVSSDGTIKGITSGETTITAKLGDVKVEIVVRVK